MGIGFGVFRVVIRICPEAQHAPEAEASVGALCGALFGC
jgi:hypothetical protein